MGQEAIRQEFLRTKGDYYQSHEETWAAFIRLLKNATWVEPMIFEQLM
jgi:hypothetical protein